MMAARQWQTGPCATRKHCMVLPECPLSKAILSDAASLAISNPCNTMHMQHLHICTISIQFVVGDILLIANTLGLGDELHCSFVCAREGIVCQPVSGGSMHLFMSHKDQKAVSHCLNAILQDMNTDRPRKPGWLNDVGKSLSLPMQ